MGLVSADVPLARHVGQIVPGFEGILQLSTCPMAHTQ